MSLLMLFLESKNIIIKFDTLTSTCTETLNENIWFEELFYTSIDLMFSSPIKSYHQMTISNLSQ